MNTKEQFARVLALLKGSRCQHMDKHPKYHPNNRAMQRCPAPATCFAVLQDNVPELMAGCADHMHLLMRRGSIFAQGMNKKRAIETSKVDFAYLESELETASFDTQPPPESSKNAPSWDVHWDGDKLSIKCLQGDEVVFHHECPNNPNNPNIDDVKWKGS